MVKRHTRSVIVAVQAGVEVASAVASVAVSEAVDVATVIASMRRSRYLVVNSHDKSNRMRATRPEDVEVLEYGPTADDEAWRIRLMSWFGVSISALPSVIAWQDEHDIDDGEGGVVVVPAGFRAAAVRSHLDYKWAEGAADDDRKAHPDAWARRSAIPPLPAATP